MWRPAGRNCHGTTVRGNQGGLRLPPQAAPAAGRHKARPLHSPEGAMNRMVARNALLERWRGSAV
jgi:hypothetical protein